MNILKILQFYKSVLRNRRYLMSRNIEDYKFDRNPLKMFKGAHFCYRSRRSICNIVEKQTSLQVILNQFIYVLRTPAYQRTPAYSRCIALHFQLLQLALVADRWSTFYEIRMNRLNGQHLLWSVINKKETKT